MLDGVDPSGPVILYDAQDGKYLDDRQNGKYVNASAPLDKPILGVARLADPDDKYLKEWRRAASTICEIQFCEIQFVKYKS